MKLSWVILALCLAGCAATPKPDYSMKMYLQPNGDYRIIVESQEHDTEMTLKFYELQPN